MPLERSRLVTTECWRQNAHVPKWRTSFVGSRRNWRPHRLLRSGELTCLANRRHATMCEVGPSI